MKEAIVENLFLVCLFGVGVVLTLSWPLYGGDHWTVGVAFLVSSSVGMYMMLTTRKVAQNLHERFNSTHVVLQERFNETNGILQSIQTTQKESQKEAAAFQKESAVFQKETTASLKEIAASQKETTASLNEVVSTLKEISKKLDK